MKILVTAILTIFWMPVIRAQSVKEWVDQKKTQTEYLLQQIVANYVYLDYIKKGYVIAKDGLSVINSFKKGEFSLHFDFIKSLEKVNPQVKRYSRVAEVMSLQTKFILAYRRMLGYTVESNVYSKEESEYIRRVLERLLTDSELITEELITITTNGKLEMRDDERLERIDSLFFQMQDQYSFLQFFSEDIISIAANRTRENDRIKTSRALYGINDQ